jgi:hypothetical protein
VAKSGIPVWLGAAIVIAVAAVLVVVSKSPDRGRVAPPSTTSPTARVRGTEAVAVPDKMQTRQGLHARGDDASEPPPSPQASEARFRDQPRDAASLAAEDSLLRAVVDQQLATSGITPRNPPDVACRQDSCRITARFRSQSDAADWATLYMTVAATELSRAEPVFVAQPDGSVEMRLYAERRH